MKPAAARWFSLRTLGVAAALLTAALLVTLAFPVERWRTGDRGLMPLDAAPVASTPPLARRLWIDTDAACGHARRTDPDDCFAIALLARSAQVDMVGISVVAGNAALEVVERTTRALVAETGRPVPVHAGRAAHQALRDALEQGPLTILALGPLTNVAAVLDEHPALAARVSRLIAVMGRRPGHLFHPAEGAGGGMLFGHGPVFRDLNFALDPRAAARVLALRLPTSLVPYDAARGVEITPADLDRLTAQGGAAAWVAQRARAWLDYWREDIGRQGFYPFDLLAAAYVLEPSWLRCTPVRAWVGDDRTMVMPWRPQALLIEPGADSPTLYCGRAGGGLKPGLMERFTADRAGRTAAWSS
ncbi:MAG TPA: nucleoside hydrolase [Burkholderiales bacterium]